MAYLPRAAFAKDLLAGFSNGGRRDLVHDDEFIHHCDHVFLFKG
jgi:hypothetical protein